MIKILQEGMIPNFCKEEFSTNTSNYVVGIPMISFCDIPLTRTDIFTGRYGNHAIGLSKEWALRNGINPILYISNEDIISSLRFYRSYELHLQTELRNIGSDGNRISIDLNNPASVSNIVPFINHNNAKDANLNFWGYAKPYDGIYKGKKQCNYEENEWRYVVKEGNGIAWKWGENDYENWRGNRKEKPQPGAELKSKKLSFSIEDITHLIVEKDSQIIQIMKSIKSLTTVGDTNQSVSDEQKEILISKIISFERIKKDF